MRTTPLFALAIVLLGFPTTASADLSHTLLAERTVMQLRESQIDGILSVAVPYFQKRLSARLSAGERAEVRAELLHLLTSAESKWREASRLGEGDQVAFTLEVLAQEIGQEGFRRRLAGELMLRDLEALPTTVATDAASREARLAFARRKQLVADLEVSLLAVPETDPVSESFHTVFGRYLPDSSDPTELCLARDARPACALIQRAEKTAMTAADLENEFIALISDLNRRSSSSLKVVAAVLANPGQPRVLPDPKQTRRAMSATEASLSLAVRLAPGVGADAVSLGDLARVSLDLYASASSLHQQVSAGRAEVGLVRVLSSVLGLQILEATRLARASAQPRRFETWVGFKPTLMTLLALEPVRQDRPATLVLEAALRAVETLDSFSKGGAVSDDVWKAQVLSLSESLVQADRGRFFLLEPGYSRALDHATFDSQLRDYLPQTLQRATVADDPSGKLQQVAGNLENDEVLFPLLAGVLSAPAWSQINLIQEIVGGRYKDHSLQSEGQRLPDIERWTVETAPLIRALARDREQVFLDPGPTRAGVAQVLKSADAARRAALGLKTALANPVEVADRQSIRLALRDYVASFRHLADTIDHERRDFEKSQLAGMKMNQDLAGQSATGNVAELSKSVPPCAGLTFPSAEGKPGVQLPPLDVESFGKKALGAIPRSVRNALLLNRGKLDACYRDVSWVGDTHDETFDAAQGMRVDTISSRPKFSLVLRFIDDKNAAIDLARFTLEGKKAIARRQESRQTEWFIADDFSYYSYKYLALTGKAMTAKIKQIQGLDKFKGLTVKCDPTTSTYTDAEGWTRYRIHCWVSGVDSKDPAFQSAYAEPPEGAASYMEKALLQEDREALFAEAANSVTVESLKPLIRSLDTSFETLRRETVTAFDKKIRENFLIGPSRLHSAAMSVAGSKALLAALLEIAMPDTMARDESVRDQMLKGVGLPDETTIVSYLHQAGTTIDPERSAFYNQIEEKAAALLKRLRVVALESGAELADSAESQYDRLVRLKRALDLYVPEFTLEDALESLRRDLDRLR